MKTTNKQLTISEQAVYGDLKIQVGDSIRTANGAFTEYRGEYLSYTQFECNSSTGMLNTSKIKPILRPLDLTKEITHKGYNDDKPFIPVVELAKTQYEDFEFNSIEIIDECTLMCKGYSKKLSKRIMKENVKYNCAYWFHINSSERHDEERDLLHLLHFDTRNLIGQGEAVDVNSLPHNPYEV